MEIKNKIQTWLAIYLVFLVVGQASAPAAPASGVGVETRSRQGISISISSALPPGKAFTDGFIVLELSLPSGKNLQDDIVVYLDGVEKYSFKMFPTTLQIPTEGLEDGSHTVSVEAISNCNNGGYGEIVVLVEDPKITVVSIEYPRETYPGATLTITIEMSGSASHFVANFTALFGVTTLSTSSVQSGAFLSGTILIPSGLSVEERIYPIPLVVYSNDGRTLMVPAIEIFFQAGQTNPFTIEEGIIDMRSFPTAMATESTLILTLPTNFEISITTGQSVEIPFEIENSDASEVIVGFEGFGQHFIIPISSLQNQNTNQRRSTRQVNSGTQMLSFMIELPPGSVDSGNQLIMLMRLTSSGGGYGPIVSVPLTTSASQQGTLHIRLSWYSDVDMDLHVIDPNSEEIYYGQRESFLQEGSLDLDSNPACNLDNIRIENIYYTLAVSGQYTVRVDLWDSCGVAEQIDFMVEVEGCGVSQTLTGSFDPSEADAGGAGSGREVLVFEAICVSYIVEGTISYRKPLSGANPLGSIVRVVDDQGTVYGTAQVLRDVTDSNRGIYSVSYEPNDGNAPVYVELLSSNYKIEVTDHAGNVHVYRHSNSIIPNTEPSATRDVTILQNEGSGAFHIMVTLNRMLPTYLAYGGSTTDYPRKANWELGEYARNTNSPGSYFSPSTGIISIGGYRTRRHEFADSVLLHEFGHLTMFGTGAIITGSGSHNGSPIPPNFAFSEGYATYLGQRVIGNLMYCDGMWCFDISNLNQMILGTTLINGRSSGSISEWVVAGAAYKLDTEIGLGIMMALALHSQDQLLLQANYNRLGSLTAVDFSDMVSITVCPLEATRRTMAATLLNEYSLPWIAEIDFCL